MSSLVDSRWVGTAAARVYRVRVCIYVCMYKYSSNPLLAHCSRREGYDGLNLDVRRQRRRRLRLRRRLRR